MKRIQRPRRLAPKPHHTPSQVGTDIQDNKCSWLVVQALDRATPQQRKHLEAHYGKHEASSVSG